jgi:hypothetical protein
LRDHLALLQSLLPLLDGLHLLLLLVTAVNGFANWTANGAPDIFTSMVVAQNVTRTYTVRDEAFLIFTLGNVFPKPLHSSTMRCNGAMTIFVLTFGSVSKQK